MRNARRPAILRAEKWHLRKIEEGRRRIPEGSRCCRPHPAADLLLHACPHWTAGRAAPSSLLHILALTGAAAAIAR